MAEKGTTRKTLLGDVDQDVIAFTVGKDVELDRELVVADCIGSAAHVAMLSRMPVKLPVFTAAERRKITAEFVKIIRMARRGRFKISVADQDVHMAVERVLTQNLGSLGRKVHTGRSRNDQVATDLRLYAKEQLLEVIEETLALADVLQAWARHHAAVPMVGRTHMQPAMPSSVGLWASAHAESLLDDIVILINAYELNDQCPLGSAAGYGVPLPIDRHLTARLLGFSRPVSNALYANNMRGKMEAIILSALSMVMLTLSRLAQDLILFSMPEFGYFTLPRHYCTGSSIMPQKSNPDVLELLRAKASAVITQASGVMEIIRSLPSGYHRDLQAAKEPFMEGLRTSRTSLRIIARLMKAVTVNRKALQNSFSPDVFATDRVFEMTAGGVPFRDAYRYVKDHLSELSHRDPAEAALKKTHLGAPGGLDFEGLTERITAGREFVEEERKNYHRAVSQLLRVRYPPA